MKEELIKRFVSNEAQFEAVFERMQKSFMKKRSDADVHTLAAATLSLYALEDAKRDLIALKNSGEEDKTPKISHV